MKKNVKNLVEKYSKRNGYGGLFNGIYECACFNGDLITCESNSSDCEFGYKHTCSGCGEDYVSGKKIITVFKCPECGE